MIKVGDVVRVISDQAYVWHYKAAYPKIGDVGIVTHVDVGRYVYVRFVQYGRRVEFLRGHFSEWWDFSVGELEKVDA